MAQYVSDVLQAGAAVDHTGSGGVTKHVRSGQASERDAGTRQIAPHDRADRRGLEGSCWIGKGEKYLAALMARAAVPKILGQRGAHLLGPTAFSHFTCGAVRSLIL